MQFLLLISSDETTDGKMNPAERDKMFGAFAAYTSELQKAGVMRGGEPLEKTQKGARVTVREGKTRVVDGPFTETKEVLGGFYQIECASLDEAKKWAAKCPGATYGSMEVRQIMAMPKNG